MSQRVRRVLGVLAVLLLGAFAFASADRCGSWPSGSPQLGLASRAEGPLSVGAASVPIELPGSVTIGGYGPLRSTASSGDRIFARSTVVSVGGNRLGIVSLELLLLTQPLVAKIREGADYPILVTATHTHSSLGQFDRRLAAQLGALGSFDEAVETAIVTAARQSLADARSQLAPAVMQLRQFSTTELVIPRSSDAADTRGLEVRFGRENGPAIARWLLLAAHPTLAPRRGSTFDTDWPGTLAGAFEGVTLVLQTSIGNASVNKPRTETKTAFAAGVVERVGTGEPVDQCEGTRLTVASARVDLPHPDGSRLAPWPFTSVAENALCAAEEMDVEVMMVRLGCLSLLAMPVEPSYASAKALEQMTGATRVLALSNGYVGYLEPADVVRAKTGEAKRQWFGPELFERLTSAAMVVAMTTDVGGARVPSQ